MILSPGLAPNPLQATPASCTCPRGMLPASATAASAAFCTSAPPSQPPATVRRRAATPHPLPRRASAPQTQAAPQRLPRLPCHHGVKRRALAWDPAVTQQQQQQQTVLEAACRPAGSQTLGVCLQASQCQHAQRRALQQCEAWRAAATSAELRHHPAVRTSSAVRRRPAALSHSCLQQFQRPPLLQRLRVGSPQAPEPTCLQAQHCQNLGQTIKVDRGRAQ